MWDLGDFRLTFYISIPDLSSWVACILFIRIILCLKLFEHILTAMVKRKRNSIDKWPDSAGWSKWWVSEWDHLFLHMLPGKGTISGEKQIHP